MADSRCLDQVGKELAYQTCNLLTLYSPGPSGLIEANADKFLEETDPATVLDLVAFLQKKRQLREESRQWLLAPVPQGLPSISIGDTESAECMLLKCSQIRHRDYQIIHQPLRVFSSISSGGAPTQHYRVLGLQSAD